MHLKWRRHRILNQARTALATPSRQQRMAVVLGRALAADFLLCFATGLYSRFLQNPLPWMVSLKRFIWLYQIAQGIHIAAGNCGIPLLLAKLNTVFPYLFQTPPVRSLLHLLERASIALFVAASLMQLLIGVFNADQIYAIFPISFRHTYFMLRWAAIGSLAIHIAVSEAVELARAHEPPRTSRCRCNVSCCCCRIDGGAIVSVPWCREPVWCA